MKDLLKEAGVEIDVYKAHSVRGTSTSAAFKEGVHLSDILDTVDWSKELTLKKLYYHKKIT